MQPARIAELLAPFLGDAAGHALTKNDLAYISTYVDMLLRWNARVNLTAIRDPEQIVTRHFGESLFAARHLFALRSSAASVSSGAKASSLADVGSGAGFPGIPIKLWYPALSLTLVESNHRKATFLREVARALTLTDIDIITARAETLNRDAFDVVTLRAVEHFESILPVAASLVAPSGRLALLIGASQLAAASSILTRTCGFEAHQLASTPVPLSHSRVVAIVERSSS